MKKVLWAVPAALLLTVALPALAQTSAGASGAKEFVAKLNSVILFPTISLLLGVAFLVFLWGVAEYFFNATNDQARTTGSKHMLWGIIGLVVMLSALAILRIAAATFGLDKEVNCALDPTASECKSVFRLPNPNDDHGTPDETGDNGTPNSSGDHGDPTI